MDTASLNYAVVARYLAADEAVLPADNNAKYGEFNTKLAKLMQKLKKDAGAKSIAQNYKGTGSQAFRRQLWVHFGSGAVIDLWLDKGYLKFGGVVMNGPPNKEDKYHMPNAIPYGDKTPEHVYEEAAKHLKAWANP